jgi:signal peptidase I
MKVDHRNQEKLDHEYYDPVEKKHTAETSASSHSTDTERIEDRHTVDPSEASRSTASETGTDTETEQNSGLGEFWEWTKALGVAVLIAVLIRAFLFAPIVVDGESMMPTLHNTERLIVNKAVYFWSEPQYGDIVVFHATETKDWIKRVIGVPGDTIAVQDGQLYINGEAVSEVYLTEEAIAATQDFETIVPEDQLFVMGDNRGNSQDSRSIGSIPYDAVIGRAELVFWPINEFRLVNGDGA